MDPPVSTLRKGKHKLHLWPGVEADGRVNSKTPSKVKMDDDMDKLEKVSQRETMRFMSIF